VVSEPQPKEPSPAAAGSTRLATIKDSLSIVQSLLICLSIISAGVWFYLQRDPLPKANITHEITHRRITPEFTWLHVSISITNVGKRLLHLDSGFTRIQNNLPSDPAVADLIKTGKSPFSPETFRIPWPLIDSYNLNLTIDIEPGETDILNHDFIIPSEVRTVKVYSYFERLQDLGWSKTTIYDITPSGG